ncbi:hypothetical protein LCGC14_2084380 [marine sediment metagenome]|uniref:Uncharacterized protein n=1 Tax=marine sediment metagenome TaxID=412755 RepID=A0A0F9HBN0_9ZZZZ
MKIRDGFVSNSSSTSFTLITSTDSFTTALEKMDQEHAYIIRSIIGRKTINGSEIVVLSAKLGDCGEYNTIRRWHSLDIEACNFEDPKTNDFSFGVAIWKYKEALTEIGADFIDMSFEN